MDDLKRRSTDTTGIDKDTAVKIVRGFWLAFNSMNMYSSQHPAARSNADKLHALLVKALETAAPLTFHIENNILACEEWKIDKEVLIQRLIQRLNGAGINSISFQKSIQPEHVVELLHILIDARNFQSLSSMLRHMKEKGIESIHFNHFIFQKISIDEKRKQKQETAAPKTPAAPVPAPAVPAPAAAPAAAPTATVDRIGREILQAIKATGKVGAFFQKWNKNIDTAGMILPKIKDFLFNNGITRLQYLEFLYRLSREMTPEEFTFLLQKSHGDMGLSIQAIAEEMKRNPAEIIGLVKMGIELADLLKEDRKPLVSILVQFTETALRNRALTHFTGKDVQNSEEVSKGLGEIKHELYRQMLDNELPPETLRELDKALQQRFPMMVGMILARTIVDSTLDRTRLPDEPGLNALAEKIKTHAEGRTILNSVLFLLEELGYTRELLDGFIHMVLETVPEVELDLGPAEEAEERPETRAAIKERKTRIFRLPRGIPTLKDTRKLLELEIERNLRYNSPFTCVSVSVVGISEGIEPREPEPQEVAAVFQEFFEQLKISLRILDFFGSLGGIKTNHLLIIMSMTDEEGAATAVSRLLDEVKNMRVEIEGELMFPTFVVSRRSFNPNKDHDLQTYTRRLKAQHKRELKKAKKGVEG